MSESDFDGTSETISLALARIGGEAMAAKRVRLDDLRSIFDAIATSAPDRLATLEQRTLELIDRQSNLSQLEWETQGAWRIFPFNFGNNPERKIGEVFLFDDIVIQVERVANTMLQYRCSQSNVATTAMVEETIDEPMVMLCISGLNAGHALSEIMSFMAYYERLDIPLRVGVSGVVRDRLPLIFQLLGELLPAGRLFVLEDGRVYLCTRLAMRRNRWFISVRNWKAISYQKRENIMYFEDIRQIKNDFTDPTANFLRRVGEIYAAHHQKYDLNRKIILIKSSDDPLACSPTRSMYVFPEARAMAERAGFRFVSVSDFADINEYICTLHHAEKIIVSYGSTTCTNRFFVNSNATVTVLAHLHYQNEYCATDDDWHVLHSHTFPVSKQYVILDHPNEIDEVAMETLLRLNEERPPGHPDDGGLSDTRDLELDK